MFQSIQFAIAKKLKQPKFRVVVLKARLCGAVDDIIKEKLSLTDDQVKNFITDYDSKTKTIFIYTTDQRALTQLKTIEYQILYHLQKKFTLKDVKKVVALKKFHK